MTIRLNGWQRLWVVSAGVILVVVIVHGATEFPTRQEVIRSWSWAAIDAVLRWDPNLEAHLSYQVRAAYQDLSDEALIAAIHAKYRSTAGRPEIGDHVNMVDQALREVELRFTERLRSLHFAQARHAAAMFAVWLFPVAGLYAFGWVAGWVIRGFKA